MKRIPILLTVLCVFGLMLAQHTVAQKAPNVSGNWDVITRMPSGNVSEKWTIRQDGEKITGTVKGPQGDGTVEGAMVDKIFFRVSVKAPDTEHLIRATADKDSMDGSITIGRAEYLWSAKRAK